MPYGLEAPRCASAEEYLLNFGEAGLAASTVDALGRNASGLAGLLTLLLCHANSFQMGRARMPSAMQSGQTPQEKTEVR